VPFADTNLLAIPDEVDDERALFVGDVLTTGLYGASLAAVSPEETAAVVGLGPVGYCTVQALFALGARTVFGIDVDPARRALAEAAGAIPVDAVRVNPQMVLARATQDRGADAVIEAVGSSPAYETSVDVVRRGGRVVVVGMYAGEVTELQLGVYWARALSVRFAGLCPTHAYWQRTMALLAAGRLDPSPIVSHRLSLEEAAEGYELFDRRLATKVLLAP
jgi:threonine dehydrogenase-like Zn-dependent dehydrogenase